RRCELNRSFCTNCGSSVFVEEGAKETFSASPVSRSCSVSATPRSLRALQRSAATSFDRTAVATAAKALRDASKAARAAPSFSLGPLIRLAILVSVLWVGANWLLEIAEVRALKDAIQRGEFSDDSARAAADAVRARLDA